MKPGLHKPEIQRKPSPVGHFVAAIICATVSIAWFSYHNVGVSLTLDLRGIEVPGKAVLLGDYRVLYEFTTKEGQKVREVRDYGVLGDQRIIYLVESPDVFKVRGEGKASTIIVLLFAILAIWQTVAGLKSMKGHTLNRCL
ncbi:MAG: hypothetical protein GXO71_05885 [Caldiserica bacterium]|nr:hypothetical protein [Caldisericota bacterium]